jgi:hypothetical protein
VIQKERLLKLAEFLDSLPEEKFDFMQVMCIEGKPPIEALAAGHEDCGTKGCAIGWCPVVFPELVTWVPGPTFYSEVKYVAMIDGPLVYAGQLEESIMLVGKLLFGLDQHQTTLLFMPNTADFDDEDVQLSGDARPIDIAAHIRKFVAGIK